MTGIICEMKAIKNGFEVVDFFILKERNIRSDKSQNTASTPNATPSKTPNALQDN